MNLNLVVECIIYNINMTVININKKLLTKQDILNEMTDLDVYGMYMDLNNVNVLGKSFNSPLSEDNKPSFGFFQGESNEICFNDWRLGKGDFIKFVMLMFNLSYYEALCKIAIDSNMNLTNFIIKYTFKTDINSKNNIDRLEFVKKLNTNYIGKTSRNWELKDFIFWNKFGITHDILKKYDVEPISYLHLGANKDIIKTHYNTYCFNEYKDGKNTFKIYQPFNLDYKWLSNHDDSIWQGWNQLPDKGDLLIITKSLKDVMSINNITEIPVVSLQSESIIPKQSVINELRDRFKVIYLLYDNDYDKVINWGQKFAENLSEKFKLINIKIPDSYKSKDFSDLVKNKGINEARELLLQLTATPF